MNRRSPNAAVSVAHQTLVHPTCTWSYSNVVSGVRTNGHSVEEPVVSVGIECSDREGHKLPSREAL